jgi:beta-ketoacyl-acyl-carrier-protein synthase II
MSQNNHQRRVVITGVGGITVLGPSIDHFWEGLLAGRSGIRRITQFDASAISCQIAGEIPEFDPGNFMDRKEARRVSRMAQITLAAAVQAVADAGLPEPLPEPERSGVVFATAMGGIERADEGIQTLRTKGVDRVNPFTVSSCIPNLGAFLVAQRFQCQGPSLTVTTACAAGTQAVGEAAELIWRGAADVVVCGGAEALIQDYAVGGFAIMRALPTSFNDNPTKASRPFDAKREGFCYSEGSGALVLETLEHAQARGARIYAEVIGEAASCDAYHVAQPDPSSLGQMRAMKWALESAGIQPTDVDYINTHGTSTPLNDASETRAIKMIFGEHAYKLVINSTKSMTGHAMGASGALEAITCAKQIYHGVVHPTINYEYPDPECDLDYTPNEKRQYQINVALSNSFGLGGQNACLVLKRFVS